jgi:hypothetical protein
MSRRRWFARLLAMGRICYLQVPRAGQVEVSINTADHCDPHVHCQDRGRSWELRVRFSFMNVPINFWDCLTPRSNPGSSVHNEIVQQLYGYLRDCRAVWWRYYSQSFGCCLTNTQQMDQVGQYRVVQNATYDPIAYKTRLTFAGGFTREVML